MKKLEEIIKYPNPLLETKCEQVTLPLSKEDEKILDELYETLKNTPNSVGLAAPQIGVTKRMFVIRKVIDGKVVFNCKMVNPIIIPKGTKTYKVPGGEGCLSEPGIYVEVVRKKSVLLTGYDAIQKKKVMYMLNDFLAAVAQHELDHLNGICLQSKGDKQ